ncbi:VOC family protein [Fluoribacter dumoffii]|uniref:27 kDa antigen Cfp30B n=1 Tax=Fluoribacter dumoffii TaxID=463 RepID=A0A377G7D5_9GAMM|nr:VOC family protein [Fluoribacter dumoffii]KTC89621.1 glyoxalase/bleomycin resistance protein [Fluoribacter dumoffii NY 23]MCW8384814.1 VOC family protein [Fluoribacter dumoffii]MCW8417877.1 VOC family protein [Fluoribacter dumoffii]MCW8454281.1 VOC family protein [Fluoribacter dumoffii]MCW8461645.1 VOC family protein [Fluoribacter dumoffii]
MSQHSMGQFCWNELATADVQKAKEFYSKVLGWKFKEIHSGDMTYTIVQIDDKDIAGIWQIPTKQQNEIPPHWMAYILVDNAADTLAKAKQNGAEEIKEVTHVGDMGLFAIIKDPTGAHIAFWETKK